MKAKIIILVFLFIPFISRCNMPWTKSQDRDEASLLEENSSKSGAATESKTTDQSTLKQLQSNVMQKSSKTASASMQTTSADKSYVINELTFEVKKLSAEVKHLRSELQDLQARSQMWMNPLAMYNKEIIMDNGSSIFGKIIYQDDKIIKVETLMGFLVLDKPKIVRVITNIPEKPAEQYVPEELAIDMQGKTSSTQPVQPNYISKTKTPSEITESSVKTANCVLVGNIKEKKDRSGNTIFSGEVKNIGNRRADFVKINFVFRKNWSGDTQTRTAFVEGSYFTFEDSGITTNNSLLPGASGTFELILQKSFGNFIGYSYTIDWEQYK
ncbi:MAG: hypothetical protein DRP89_00440 [Candidatus Neomarinimicrobiota bacterium]|nr:MAG: hypothetical protein DRP89_00440 [Candidatus Neomarinimicrobiota bacterium]